MILFHYVLLCWCCFVLPRSDGLQRTDDLTGGSALVLQADVNVEADLACRIYDSCKNVAIVGETTAMQSGLVGENVLAWTFRLLL